MRDIFTGLIFLFLDFNLDIGQVRIGLIPAFVGYIFMARGLQDLLVESPHFSKARAFTVPMTVYTAIVYALNVFGAAHIFGTALSLLLGLAASVVAYYMVYCIIMGVRDIEAAQGRSLGSDALYRYWLVMIVAVTAATVLSMLPALAFLGFIAGIAGSILFLVAFSRTKKLYEEHQLP